MFELISRFYYLFYNFMIEYVGKSVKLCILLYVIYKALQIFVEERIIDQQNNDIEEEEKEKEEEEEENDTEQNRNLIVEYKRTIVK